MMTVLHDIGRGLEESFFMLWQTAWALVLGFGLSGAVQAFASRAEIEAKLGDHRPRSILRASGYGVVSSSCSYAASAMAKSLFAKGADFVSSMVFMVASTNLVIELGLVLAVLIGWQFTAAEFVGGAIMIGLLAIVGSVAFRGARIERARARLAVPDLGEGAHCARSEGWSRLRSLGGWADAATYTLSDLTMLRREMLIGYLVAGFLAALVPTTVWQVVFLHGRGALTAVENVLVGPFVALISFVCSIGNVPLAAALWHGGISFGGVVSFIFADLIAMPLVLIYRRYYGWGLTLRILVVFWGVMAVAGLVVQALFGAVGILPTSRPLTVVPERIGFDPTTFANVGFLALFVVMWWLSRHRARFGGGQAYAIDPICGMQVERQHAPAVLTVDGERIYFCSDHCAARYEERAQHVEDRADHEAYAIDPICGMQVERQHAPAVLTVDGERIYFCSDHCAARYEERAKVDRG
jgi:uncharacterized membrane protein YraQ (UPF0718 family)